MTNAWVLIAGVILLLMILLATGRWQRRVKTEAFQSGGELLTTGVEVAFWFASHVYLQGASDVAPTTSVRLLYPEEIPTGQGLLLWMLESSRDPPGTPARFQLFHSDEPIRIRSVSTGQYLVWRPTDTSAAGGDRDRFVPGTLLMRPFDQLIGQEALWRWELRGSNEVASKGLQWGDRVVFRPLVSRGALVLQGGVPTVTEQPITGSEEILLVDRWGRGREKEQARFGRARASTGSDNTDAYLAIDGREDTYCRLIPTGSERVWWELELPMGKTWVDRLAVHLPEMQPSLAPQVTVSLWAGQDQIIERTLRTEELQKAVQTQVPARMLTWEDIRAHVQRIRIQASGPLYLASVKVFGTPSAMLGEEDLRDYIPPQTVSMLPGNVLQLGAPGGGSRRLPPPVERPGSELPSIRHYLSAYFWLRVESSGAPRTLLWEWEHGAGTGKALPGWRVWVDPLKRLLEWNLYDRGGTMAQQLKIHVEDLVGRDAHVALFLRAPVSKQTGWQRVPGVCVVHPRLRIVYRLGAESPDVSALALYPTTPLLQGMQDLGLLEDSHLKFGMEMWVDGKKRGETTEVMGIEDDALRRLVPAGTWRVPTLTVPEFYAVLRSMRLSNTEPHEDTWASLLREGGTLLREIQRFPVRAAELPVTGEAWCFGAWIFPRRRRTRGTERVVAMMQGQNALWSWVRVEDANNRAQFQWMNTNFDVPLEEWSWVVLSYAPMKSRVFVQGRLVRTQVMIQATAVHGDLETNAVAAEVSLARCKFGNISIDREDESWTLRSIHPETEALRGIERAWEAAGCPGRWDLERDTIRTRRWLDVLQQSGPEALEREMRALYDRAQRYLRQQSPRDEVEADRAAVETCFYPVPVDTWDRHWKAAQKQMELRTQTAAKCLPMAPYTCKCASEPSSEGGTLAAPAPAPAPAAIPGSIAPPS